MNKIVTYHDLLTREKQLEDLLQAQKDLLLHDMDEMKEALHPAKMALSVFSQIGTRDNSNFLLNAPANKLIDLLVKKVVLGRAGWLTRLIVPFFLKNYTSHFIAKNKQKWIRKLFSGKHHQNGKKETATEPGSNLTADKAN